MPKREVKSEPGESIKARQLAEFLMMYPEREVRIQVVHDLDCEIVRAGKVYAAVLKGKKIQLECGDDVS